MTIHKINNVDDDLVYDKIENIVMNKVSTLEMEDKLKELENENAQLKNELTIAKAKLEIYERLTNISNSKMQLGFTPSLNGEGGV